MTRTFSEPALSGQGYGRNGSSKSTLLPIAAGLVQPDAGDRFAQPSATIHYLPQEPKFGANVRLTANPTICWGGDEGLQWVETRRSWMIGRGTIHQPAAVKNFATDLDRSRQDQ